MIWVWSYLGIGVLAFLLSIAICVYGYLEDVLDGWVAAFQGVFSFVYILLWPLLLVEVLLCEVMPTLKKKYKEKKNEKV